jgi:hypothetical protein
MRAFIKFLMGFVLIITLFIGGDIARASIFGEENVILSKILLEDIQQTFRLKDIVGFATKELKLINQKYGYEKWLNQGLNELKDYGVLKHIKTDDYIMGKLQTAFDGMGFYLNADEYNLENLDEWVDQIWGKAPELINAETEYPGTFSEWSYQAKNNLPGVYSGFSPIRSMAGRNSAELAYKHAIWNLKFNDKARQAYEELYYDAHLANPGKANRISAQSNALQNAQLSKISTTQSSILRLMAENTMSRLQDDGINQQAMQDGFEGIEHIFKFAPTFGK